MASRLSFALAALGIVVSTLMSPASAQTTTGQIRGYVTDDQGAPVASADVVARNTATGATVRTTSGPTGFYSLLGLRPAEYEITIRAIGRRPEARRVRVLIGQALTLDLRLTAAAVQLAEVVVTPAPVVDLRTSEVGTNVTQEQINDLPSSSRNFLDLATLAPGTSIQNDRLNGVGRKFSAGAQAPEQTNLFIDGASYKNDLIRGGMVGQDRSRGNPFPRNAVQEFRILTQNYKAEYQKSSSAIITATTKSGGNVWAGNAFFSYQDKGLVGLDTFQIAAKNADPATFREPDYERYLVGLSVGGPMVRDRLHFFGSYEGNYQDRSNLINIVPPTGFPALDTVAFASRNGFFGSPFRSTLLFGKLTYAAGENSTLELSYNGRHENDTRDFGGLRSFESGVRFRNNVNTGVAKFRHFQGSWLHETTVTYQRAQDNPSLVPGDDPVNRFYAFGCCVQIGPNITIQDFTQKRLALRHDLTYSGLEWNGPHVLKAGISVDFLNYRILKRNGAIPRFVYEEFAQGAGAPDSFAIPDRVEFRAGNPNFVKDNTQFGVFVQDDWTPSRRLTLNIGIRWDYETNMLNYDYVTPQAIVDSVTKYADSLFIPIDPNRYFTNGTQRPRFTGAFQPRLGFSYALDEDGRTTIFGGFGIFYDRTLFDQAVEETFAQQQPRYVIRFREPGSTATGRIDWDDAYLESAEAVDSLRLSNPQAGLPEVKLIPNDLRPPKSRHFSVGLRRLFGDIAVEAAYTGVRSSNVFTFSWANQNFTCPERSFSVAGCFVNRPVPGYAVILVADDAGETWYDALQIKVDRPYRRTGDWGWGAGLAYTYAERETAGFNDDFSFPNPVDYPRQVRNDERHRVVAHWLVDLPFAYGIQLGGLVTVGSGVNQDVGARFGGPTNPFEPGAFDNPTFKNVDLRLRKDFPPFGRTRIAVTADLFNAFNWQNLGGFITGNRSDARFGEATNVISDPRRLQIGTEVNF